MKRMIFFLVMLIAGSSFSQNLVYVDKKGILRFTKDKKEAAFFGVNYTVPFAYGYRSVENVWPAEHAIEADVEHMARLGLDAFRVHVWDVEVSDSAGNLLNNRHLQLFDYLLAKLKQHNIRALITPIAFWGNGYPEPDEKTPGFSTKYGKGQAVVLEEAIKAQENYLRQFVTHVNKTTGLSYMADPNIIALEINNEPHHSGPKEKTTEYINRLVKAVRSAGWTKPIFYNISESPTYADAVVKANVNGHSFQWYPTGLVANHEQKGNFLPNVDQYPIPFGDTIAAFNNRAKMVYEFDAADVMQPIMYPAMARSYRSAGFQWATQFAYDPIFTAWSNTEYQTHYLNLVYTPAKAISLMIASQVFHRLPRLKQYGSFPNDTLFDVFRISYKEQLSLMNDDTAFYYSNSNNITPKNVQQLKHVAGVGNSVLVKYEGKGAYFLDKVSDSVWTLEIMPDAIALKDPFDHTSWRKEVTRLQWQYNKIQIALPGLAGTFYVDPGVHFFKNGKHEWRRGPGYPPPMAYPTPDVAHNVLYEVTAGKSFPINFQVVGDTIESVTVEIRNSSNKWKTVQAQKLNSFDYSAEVPAEMVTPGVINYRVMVHLKDKTIHTFPGGFQGDPYAWDESRHESWQTYVASAETPLELFNTVANRNYIMPYNPDWRNNTIEYVTTATPGQLAVKAVSKNGMMGWQFFFGEKIAGRSSELNKFTKLVVRARSAQESRLKIGLISADADAFSLEMVLSDSWENIIISLSSLQRDSFLLLPRPYPGFLPLYFKSQGDIPFDITKMEKLECRFSGAVEIESVWLEK